MSPIKSRMDLRCLFISLLAEGVACEVLKVNVRLSAHEEPKAQLRSVTSLSRARQWEASCGSEESPSCGLLLAPTTRPCSSKGMAQKSELLQADYSETAPRSWCVCLPSSWIPQ